MQTTVQSRNAAQGDVSSVEERMAPRKTYARLIGALFLVGFLTYGIGLTLAAGSVSEIFGLPLSLFLLIPGALFEVGIAFWLIFKGFQPAAVARGLSPSVGRDRPSGEIAAPVAVAT